MDTRRYLSRDYVRMADQVRDFRVKLAELVTHTVPFGPPGITFETELEGHEDEVARLRAEVSYLAGAAQRGFVVTNTLVNTTMESGQRVTLNPAAAWHTILQPKAMMGRADVIEAANIAEGTLRSLAAERESEQGTLAGRMAAVIRFPNRVRELTGYSAGSTAGKATEWSVAAVLVGATGSVLASAVWALLTYVF